MNFPNFSPVGDAAISAQFGNVIAPEINRRIRQVMEYIVNQQDDAIIELVPTYCALLIQYNPLVYSYDEMCAYLTRACENFTTSDSSEFVSVVHIPTCYGGEYGMDIEFVAEHNHLTIDDVVSIHSGVDYLVYMLGFIPGFTYLGGLDPRLETPRLSTPRTLILAGSVGIAGNQTGTYPSDSPGGWQIIGRTPIVMYDMNRDIPSTVNAGDYVRYVPISSDEFRYIENYRRDYTVEVLQHKVGDIRGNY